MLLCPVLLIPTVAALADQVLVSLHYLSFWKECGAPGVFQKPVVDLQLLEKAKASEYQRVRTVQVTWSDRVCFRIRCTVWRGPREVQITSWYVAEIVPVAKIHFEMVVDTRRLESRLVLTRDALDDDFAPTKKVVTQLFPEPSVLGGFGEARTTRANLSKIKIDRAISEDVAVLGIQEQCVAVTARNRLRLRRQREVNTDRLVNLLPRRRAAYARESRAPHREEL